MSCIAKVRLLITKQPVFFLLIAGAVWYFLYQSLLPFSEYLVQWFPVEKESHLGKALQFFLYDTPKVLLLLTGIVFVMGMVNSYFTPERTRALLAHRGSVIANMMAASLGIVTPFCSCSAVPLFIGFVQAGVPLGVTFSFLISAPMVNEVALTLLFGLFGWKIALLYLALGLLIAILSGCVIGRMQMEQYLEDWVREIPKMQVSYQADELTLSDRLESGFASVRQIVGRVWPYILAGIAIGAGIHGLADCFFQQETIAFNDAHAGNKIITVHIDPVTMKTIVSPTTRLYNARTIAETELQLLDTLVVIQLRHRHDVIGGFVILFFAYPVVRSERFD